jgi:hypothetical protein
VGVVGTSEGRTWALAQLEANQLVFDLCSLLTIVWNAPVVPSSLPDDLPNPADFRTQNERRYLNPLGNGFEADEFDHAADGWLECIRADDQLRDAVRIYAQAERLAQDHPSLAFVAYVSSIEAVGQRLYPPTECRGVGEDADHCGSCQRKSGAMRAFQVAIETVFDEATAKRLKTEAYGLRSQTAHSGVLHGDEDGRNRSFVITSLDDGRDFRFKKYEIAQVAANVLRAALSTCSASKSALVHE